MKIMTVLLGIATTSCFLVFISSFAEADTMTDIKLIIRGDDMGMTQGSLVAFEKAFNEGVLTCASIQVPAPWFEGAAELSKKNPVWCVGVHLTAIGEWRGYRWRPALPWDKVSSLVDEDGFLYRHPDELIAHNPKPEEMEAEFRAQIELALKKGINVQYLDLHYLGSSKYPPLEGILRQLGREFNLPISGTMGETRIPGVYRDPVQNKKKLALKQLDELKPGLWLWVAHLGIDSPEQKALIHFRPHPVFSKGMAEHRAAELEVLTSPEVKSMIQKRGIRLTNYRELWKEKNKE
jgi:predicted glycoside hydrolase/deacetylase ChbG (UPF0249 family)